MPEFSTPFSVKRCDRKLYKEEIIRAIRFNIAAEYEAIQMYEQLAESIEDKDVKKVLYEVAGDEKVHVGCFRRILDILYPEENVFEKQGENEIDELLKSEQLKKASSNDEA